MGDPHPGRGRRSRFAWPDDLWVVQLGGLIGDGPDNPAVLTWVSEAISRVDGRWCQLLGPREAALLGWGPRGGARPAGGAATLRRWVEHGTAQVAVAAELDGRAWLITHGGLTRTRWAATGKPVSPADAARALNGGVADRPTVGALRAAPDQLARSWAGGGLPLPQLVCDDGRWWRSPRDWTAGLPAELATTPAFGGQRHRILGDHPLVALGPARVAADAAAPAVLATGVPLPAAPTPP